MLEEKKAVPENNLLQLRKKLEQLSPQQGFRRKVIGGISEEDVQQFVKNLYEKAEKNEEIYKKKIEELTAYEEELHKNLEAENRELVKVRESAGYLQYLNTKMEEDIQKLNEELEQARLGLPAFSRLENNGVQQSELDDSYKIEVKRLEKEVSQLTRDKEDMVTRISELEKDISLSRSQLAKHEENRELEKGNEYVSEKIAMLEEQLKKSHKKLNKTEQTAKEMEQKFKREQMNTAKMSEENANLEARIAQLRDETYKQLEVLAEQIKERGMVEDQLSYERIRANNVEDDMAELVEMVLNLRGNFQNEQRQLDDELGVLKKKHYENSLEESGYQYIEEIMQQTSQDIENIFLSAQNNVNSILNNANEKAQEISMYYNVFKSDVIGFHSNLESFQGKTNEWLETLYSAVDKSHGLDEVEDY